MCFEWASHSWSEPLRSPDRTDPGDIMPAGDGCRDYAPYLGLSSALAMWRALGPPRCRGYCRALLEAAVGRLTASWGTHALAPPSMRAGSMALVALPPGISAIAEAFLVDREARDGNGGRLETAARPATATDSLLLAEGSSALRPSTSLLKEQSGRTTGLGTTGSEAWTGEASSADAKLILASLLLYACLSRRLFSYIPTPFIL